MRSGEKLFEELLIGDNVMKTNHELILRSEEEMISWDNLELIIKQLKIDLNSRDYNSARNSLIKAVPGYKPKKEIEDPMHLLG